MEGEEDVELRMKTLHLTVGMMVVEHLLALVVEGREVRGLSITIMFVRFLSEICETSIRNEEATETSEDTLRW